jgi:zinc protease
MCRSELLKKTLLREKRRTVIRKTRAVILILLIGFSFILPLPILGEEIGKHVHETVLDNGLRVILLENHKAPVVTFQVWYRVGSRNEEWGKTGLSHMLEHMMFKGTKKVGPEEFSRIIQENGGNDNALHQMILQPISKLSVREGCRSQ